VPEHRQEGQLQGSWSRFYLKQISICEFINLRKAKPNAPEKSMADYLLVVLSWFQINSLEN